MKRSTTAPVVLCLIAAGCGTGGPAQESSTACWGDVLRMRNEGASPATWLEWASRFPAPEPNRRLTGWTRKIGHSYELGRRRYLVVQWGNRYWANDWTGADSEFKVEMPNASYVWVECDFAISTVENVPDDVSPEEADCWVLVVHDSRIGIVSVRDRKGLLVDHPCPPSPASVLTQPVPIPRETKPSLEELIEMDGDTPVLRERR